MYALQTDKELESVIGETDEDNNWLPLKDEKENEVWSVCMRRSVQSVVLGTKSVF